MFDKEVLDMLACPKCKNGIKIDDKQTFFICDSCNVKYPIEDGIPELLIEKAVPSDKSK